MPDFAMASASRMDTVDLPSLGTELVTTMERRSPSKSENRMLA